MAALLGLAAAAGYGAGDFFGGSASRRAGVLPVVLWSQATSGVVALVVLAPFAVGPPAGTALAWGGAAGGAVSVGLAVYFRGLARARMGVVAPITAVVAAALPVGVGLLAGERPSQLATVGVLLAIGAVAAVSLAPSPAGPPGAGVLGLPPGSGVPGPPSGTVPRWSGWARAPGVVEGVAAGVAFGLFFVCMDRVGPGPAVWPLAAAYGTSTLCLAAVAASRRAWRAAWGAVPVIVASGVCGAAASLAFLLAVRQGLLSLVSVLAGLSPAVTVALARLVLGERLSRLQLAGLAAAVAGVGLIAAG